MVLRRLRDVRLYLRVIIVTDYGGENPLFYDYYGFSPELFQLKFKSPGNSRLANHIVSLYNKVGDLDLSRALTTLTCIFPGRVDRQDHTTFRASWRGRSWEKVSRP